jgi:hypothetical protein
LKVADGVDLLFADLGLGDERHAGLDLAKQARQQRSDLKVVLQLDQVPCLSQ